MRSALLLLVACAGSEAPVCPPVAAPRAQLAAPPLDATAIVCVPCTGVSDGTPRADLYLVVDARAAIDGLHVAAFDLVDDAGALVVRGVPRANVWILGPRHDYAGSFDGTLRRGQHVELAAWATLPELVPPPSATQYHVVLVARDGVRVELRGALSIVSTA